MFSKILQKFNISENNFNLIVILFWFFLIGRCCYCTELTQDRQPRLLKTQDGFIIENGVQATEQDVRLEDFFWTGSGDGQPPTYVRKPISDSSGRTNNDQKPFGRETILKTSTIIATVYVDGTSDQESICMFGNCNEDSVNQEDHPNYEVPSDRRFWLLTILGGYFGADDSHKIEKRLSQLYRIAFSRQQSQHLGIDNNTLTYLTPLNENVETNENNDVEQKQSFKIEPTKLSDYKQIQSSNSMGNFSNILKGNGSIRRIYKRSLLQSMENSTESTIKTTMKNMTYDDINETKTFVRGNITKLMRVTGIDDGHHKLINNDKNIIVLVHNVTFLNEDSIPSNGTSGNLMNQTEIIYSVFVNGKPVLATTAALDMKLVTEKEVANVMEKMVYTKAEPYLKESLATPLMPPTVSTDKQNAHFFAVFLDHPIMLAIAIIMVLVLVSLLIGLVLMAKSKRKRSAEIKRLTSRQSLIEEQSSPRQIDSLDIVETVSLKIEDNEVGVDNRSYDRNEELVIDGKKQGNKIREKKSGKPVLHFPQPPASSPSTSSSTSDSSVYYPKRLSRLNIQNLLDEKAVKLFHKKSHGQQPLNDNQDDAIYATITKKKDRKQQQKHRRKYLSENRVGSLEQSSASDVADANNSKVAAVGDGDGNHYYDRVAAININSIATNYNKNKLINDGNFIYHSQEGEDDDDLVSPGTVEAYNKEILNALQRHNNHQSPGSGSIGSFLSMASIRSFPKCSVPESLSRVLEPLSVMHLDQHSDDIGNSGTCSGTKPKKRVQQVQIKNQQINDDSTNHLVRSQSDGADPGVIGPVVWEIHKKQIEADVLSPLRDPVKTRNRFEQLLEGAITMYSGNDNENTANAQNEINYIKNVGAVRSKDNRGKTANPSRKHGILLRSSSEFINRPVTASQLDELYDQKSAQSTRPPSPQRRAWGSGAPSPLVRPLSAGPFHRPEPPTVDVTRILALENSRNFPSTAMSTAPLIEAIQNELHKFDRENNKF